MPQRCAWSNLSRKNCYPAKFGERLIFMWPFGEANAAAIRTLKTRAGSRRAQWHLAGHERGRSTEAPYFLPGRIDPQICRGPKAQCRRHELFARFDGGGIVRVIVPKLDFSGIEVPVDSNDVGAIVRQCCCSRELRATIFSASSGNVAVSSLYFGSRLNSKEAIRLGRGWKGASTAAGIRHV
jgi:hypothetical protein